MEKHPPRPMTPFDELVTPPSLYTLKLLLPYVPAHLQRIMAVFFKFNELKYTMETFFGFPPKKNAAPDTILQDLMPYMKPEEQNMMEQMQSMMNMMDMMKQMSDVADFSNPDGSSFSPFDLMKGMLSPEQQDMFESYNHLFEQEFEKDPEKETPQSDFRKGDSHERMDESPGNEND